MRRHCVAVLGGSFDPVHSGHVALARYFVELLQPDELRILPAGNPWQKHGLEASAAQRLAMVQLAFDDQSVPVVIDQRELNSDQPNYTIDTLRSLRAELGPQVSLQFLMGADQLQHLNTWQNWRDLFEYAHLCAAARPGFALQGQQVPSVISEEFARRAGSAQKLHEAAHGCALLATDLSVDISATEIRAALHDGRQADLLLPAAVLDYIQQHHLYKN